MSKLSALIINTVIHQVWLTGYTVLNGYQNMHHNHDWGAAQIHKCSGLVAFGLKMPLHSEVVGRALEVVSVL